jgi:putative tricarboxylic transport membrane protein
MAMMDKAQSAISVRDEPVTGLGMGRLIPPLAAAGLTAAALVLPNFMFHSDRRPDVPGLGPGAWPGAILLALATFSAIWLGMELWGLARNRSFSSLTAPDDDEGYDYGKALSGICLVLAFGWLLPILGFALATSVFLLVWCLYGGLRNPLVLILVPTLGTLTLLWMFMGLALMPLSRGVGPFERFSVWLLTLTGIY